jgi:hypothetical protein
MEPQNLKKQSPKADNALVGYRLDQIEQKLIDQQNEARLAHESLGESIGKLEERIHQILMLVTGTLLATIISMFVG